MCCKRHVDCHPHSLGLYLISEWMTLNPKLLIQEGMICLFHDESRSVRAQNSFSPPGALIVCESERPERFD